MANIKGNDFANLIIGTFRGDRIDGRGGDDLIFGLWGDDKINGGDGADTIFGGPGDDKINGGDGEDRIFGGSGDDKIDGDDGNDEISGGSGEDDIKGGKGDDTIDAGDGDDRVRGGAGADEILGGAGNDTIDGGKDNDILDGGEGNDALKGGKGDDTLDGGAGSDTVEGGKGDDLFIYDVAANVGETDVYDGGDGNDRFNLVMTAADWFDPVLQADIAAYSGGPFTFTAFDLTVDNFEVGFAIVDGVEIDLADDPVSAVDDFFASFIFEDDPLPATANVLENDSVPDLVATLTLVSQTTYGTVTLNPDGSFSFALDNSSETVQALDEGEILVDSFEYQVVDADGDMGTATATLEIVGTFDATLGSILDGAAAGDASGFSVAGIGDVNNDGFDDVLIGAYGSNAAGGRSYVVFGSATGIATSLTLSGLDGVNGFAVNGVSAGDLSGYSVAAAGDVNGDGIDDFMIGAFGSDINGSSSGSAYVVYGTGAAMPPSVDLSSLDVSEGFAMHGELSGDQAGISVASAGDINGDGFDDVLVGARYGDGNVVNSGISYVVFGGGAIPSDVELSALDGSNGFALLGVESFDLSGFAVAGAGDVNGDGIDDVIVGARNADPNGVSSGESYIVFGQAGGFAPTIDLSALDGSNGFSVQGAAGADQSGYAVSSAGDFNGDGIDDLLIGAFGADPNGTSSGASYVVYGSASGFAAHLDLAALDGTNGFALLGAAAMDQSGVSVASAGDVNGDGFDDVLIGAYGADGGGSGSGEAYLVFGTASGIGGAMDLSALDGTNGFRFIGSLAGDQLGFDVSSAGDVNGDGFDDILLGAYSADPNGSSSGQSFVIHGGMTLLEEFDLQDGSLDGTIYLDTMDL